MADMKQVRAIKVGFHGGILHTPGTKSAIFEVPSETKASWFVDYDPNAPEPVQAEAKAEKREPDTLSEIGKRRGKGPVQAEPKAPESPI